MHISVLIFCLGVHVKRYVTRGVSRQNIMWRYVGRGGKNDDFQCYILIEWSQALFNGEPKRGEGDKFII